jgi:hypothetical protein
MRPVLGPCPGRDPGLAFRLLRGRGRHADADAYPGDPLTAARSKTDARAHGDSGPHRDVGANGGAPAPTFAAAGNSAAVRGANAQANPTSRRTPGSYGADF